ncbi:MAG TPA: hypothetical protein VFP84_36655, partial [Kofleriaceae bacterium]|nr:hypothetical protein [Kofleriaceae bacterium]
LMRTATLFLVLSLATSSTALAGPRRAAVTTSDDAPAAPAPTAPTADDAPDDPPADDAPAARPRRRASPDDLPPGTPSLTAVLTAAYRAAGLDHDRSASWNRRARLSGLVPWLTARTTRDTSWQDDQSEVGHGTTVELRATWRLDRLLFDGRELQVATIEAARHRERHRLASRVIHAYFTWRRAALAASGSDERAAARLAEATAELDALTDSWFSDELSHPHGRPKP